MQLCRAAPAFTSTAYYHAPALKHAIERGLAACSQVNRVTANPLTGIVLAEFDQRVEATQIAELLRDTLPNGRNGDSSANANARALRSAREQTRQGDSRTNGNRVHIHNSVGLVP
jgi:hypothetical protein